MLISLKQREIKFKPRIKLNHNSLYIYWEKSNAIRAWIHLDFWIPTYSDKITE